MNVSNLEFLWAKYYLLVSQNKGHKTKPPDNSNNNSNSNNDNIYLYKVETYK